MSLGIHTHKTITTIKAPDISVTSQVPSHPPYYWVCVCVYGKNTGLNLSNNFVYNTVLLAVGTTLCNTSPELPCVTETLYPLTITPFTSSYLQPLATICSTLCFYESDVSEIILYLLFYIWLISYSHTFTWTERVSCIPLFSLPHFQPFLYFCNTNGSIYSKKGSHITTHCFVPIKKYILKIFLYHYTATSYGTKLLNKPVRGRRNHNLHKAAQISTPPISYPLTRQNYFLFLSYNRSW